MAGAAVAAKAAFRLRKRCPRVYLCARSSQSTSALLPSSALPPSPPPSHVLAIPCFPSSFVLHPVLLISHSPSPLFIHASPPLLLVPSPYPFPSRVQAANFSSVFLLLVFLPSPPPSHTSHSRAVPSRALYLGAVSIRVWNTGNRTTRVY